MSLEDFHRRATLKIGELRDKNLEMLANYTYRQSVVTEDGVSPGSTAEESALFLIQRSTAIQAYTTALGKLDEVFREMTASPDEKPTERENVQAKEIY